MKRAIIAVGFAFATICALEGTSYCLKCRAVECSFDTQCGVSCTCVKLNGNIKGSCVEN
jgi:hypothetical protein